MRTRRTSHVTQINRLREVYQRSDEREGLPPEASVFDQPAVQVDIERRCPVCGVACDDDAGLRCPVSAQFPEEHQRVSVLLARVRAEKSRPLAEIMTRQADALLARMLQGPEPGVLPS